MQTYPIRRTEQPPAPASRWGDPAWHSAETLDIGHFRPEGSDHRPVARARLLYDACAIYGIFHVADRYVRCVHTRHNDSVCNDSCVEFFVQPSPASYLNFEFNYGGALLAYHITDWRRAGDAFAAYTPLPAEDGAQVTRYPTLPPVIEPEVAGPIEWELQFRIPFALIARYTGVSGPRPGERWRANCYKCGDATSHPHWAAWSPVDALNFHLPHCFGEITFS
jgi:hypothetical protein